MILVVCCILLVGAAQFCEKVRHAKFYHNLGHIQEDSGTDIFSLIVFFPLRLLFRTHTGC